MGFKSGEYEGRYSTLTPAWKQRFWIAYIMSPYNWDHLYLRNMNGCIIHNNNRAWPWIRIAMRQHIEVNEFFEFKQVCRSWMRMKDLPCDKAINSVCRKDRPSFRRFIDFRFIDFGLRKMSATWSPCIFPIVCMLICRGFIDKYQLFRSINSNLGLILISERLTLLSGSFLKLQVRNSKIE